MPAQPLFIGGTSSNAGKSWVATALCASLRRRGIKVAPFKAQNMSNNSFPCKDGGEIGRAQVAQAEACGLSPETSMNPILLKPNGDGTSQVVVRGRVWRAMLPRQYYTYYDELIKVVLESYHDLASRFDMIVIEGAGSVSELNLRPFDLVNLGLVTQINAPWVLVTDIERGGVFASVVGTVALLTSEERSLFRGFLVNKFRGDLTLFHSGAEMIEERIGAPCLGIYPYAADLRLDAEDSLALETRRRRPAPPGARIAILHFPRISNATDFRLLTWAEWLSEPPAANERYDFVILPGTKHTISDLLWTRQRGFEPWIRDQYERGATVIGVCGGMQILGRTIDDPHGIEQPGGYLVEALGLLDIYTSFTSVKMTRQVRATTPGGVTFNAYEIHLGITTQLEEHFAMRDDDTPEGVRQGRLIGTYLHGAFEHASVCAEVFGVPVDPQPEKDDEYIALADWFDGHCRHAEDWLPLAATKLR
jgi:adenosylcobyric acid synthase